MKWFYTEGKLTVNSEEKERNFALADLLAETGHREKILKIIRIIFIVILIILCTLQFALTSFPADKDIFFYVGYFSTPLIISGIISFFTFAVLKHQRKEVKALNRLFKEQ
jgi:hypothetical protein|tara:strand:- start:290 stop:619 length:330 start_codon:yes stop_codon:yes gene_type:complete